MSIISWLFDAKPPQTKPNPSLKPKSVPSTASLPMGAIGSNRPMPEGKWVKATHVLEVYGIQHYRKAAEQFVMAASKCEKLGKPFNLRAEQDHSNQYDKNAIKIFGVADGQEWHIGFVDKDYAEELSQDLYSKGIEAVAHLYKIWVGKTGFIEV